MDYLFIVTYNCRAKHMTVSWTVEETDTINAIIGARKRRGEHAELQGPCGQCELVSVKLAG